MTLYALRPREPFEQPDEDEDDGLAVVDTLKRGWTYLERHRPCGGWSTTAGPIGSTRS